MSVLKYEVYMHMTNASHKMHLTRRVMPIIYSTVLCFLLGTSHGTSNKTHWVE